MYFVYLNGEKLFDPRLSEELPVSNLVLTREVNNAGSLTFTITPEHPLYDKIEGLNSFVEVYKDDEWLWQGRVMSHTTLFNNCVEYYCEGALGYLNDSYQPQKEFKDITPMGYLQVLLDTHNSQVPKERQLKQGAITITDPNNSLYRYTNYNPTLQEMKEDLIDDLGGFLRVRKFNNELYLDALKEYGHTNEQVIRFGENLKDLAKNFDFMDLATCIVPLGAKDETVEGEGVLDAYVTIKDVNKGSEYLVIDDLHKKYNNIFKVVQWNDVHVPSILKTKAEQYIKDEQFGEMVIECKAYDMNYTDKEFERFELGDKVRVISTPHGLDRYFPITKQVLYLDNIENNTLTLGGTGTPVSITGVTGRVTISTGKVDERIKEPNKLLEQAVKQATELINQGLLNGHVVITENEILIMDTPDIETAKNVWRWNAGGLGFSSNGYNGPFETAITMDGTIAGKFIAANSIAAEKIDVNYRSTVQTQISAAEDNANAYTDGKLKNYWTAKETEVQFKTTQDSILSSVSSTYTTKSEFGNLQTRVQSTEQKVTEDGIFTTINSGLKGSKYFQTTKFTMDKNGLTIQGGGLTIKNNAGKNVLYADTYGNVVIQGDFYHYNASTGYKAIDIIDNLINVYAWKKNGDWVGAIGSIGPGTNNSAGGSSMGLWCDYSDEIIIGYAPSGFLPGKSNTNYTISSIMRMNRNGINYIKGTLSGTCYVGTTTVSVSNGLITGWSTNTYYSGTATLGVYSVSITRGVITNITTSPSPLTGSITFGPHSLTFTRGMLTGNSYGTVLQSTLNIGPHTMSVTRGMITGFSYGSTYHGTVTINGLQMTFNNGILTGARNV